MKKSESSRSTGRTIGKSENIKTYSAKEIEKLRRQGKDQSRHVDGKTALKKRRADPDAPRPYAGWEKTVVAGLPRPKKSIHLRVDEDIFEFFKSQGRGHLTRMNTVLRTYVDAHKVEPG